MTNIALFRSPRLISAALLMLVVGLFLGCTRTDAKFRQNSVYLLKQERESKEDFSVERKRELDEIVSGLFGTPDAPNVPALGDVEIAQVLNKRKLEFAAGPVGRDERGRARG